MFFRHLMSCIDQIVAKASKASLLCPLRESYLKLLDFETVSLREWRRYHLFLCVDVSEESRLALFSSLVNACLHEVAYISTWLQTWARIWLLLLSFFTTWCQLPSSLCFLNHFFMFPGRLRPPCTTMPWTVWPSLMVLWGVCWMFYWPSPSEDDREPVATGGGSNILLELSDGIL